MSADSDNTVTPSAPKAPSPQWRYLVPLGVLLVGLAITIYLFMFTKELEREIVLENFDHEAVSRIATLREVIGDHILALEALESFYLSSYSVERSEFRTFTQHMLTHFHSLGVLEWIPRVPGSERAAYEAAARGDGLTGFRITELGPDGNLVTAAQRDEYFPVYYMEPYEGNESALGFDLASNSIRREALNAARDTGRVTATSKIKLVQGGGERHGILIILPIYSKDFPLDDIIQRREGLEGFVLGVIWAQELLTESLSLAPQTILDIYLYDDSAPAGERFLGAHLAPMAPGATDPPLPGEAAIKAGLHSADTIEIGGRNWIVYCVPTKGFLAAGSTWHVWGILVGGLLFAFLFAGFSLLIIGFLTESRQHAADIMKSKEKLEHEVLERERAQDQLRHSQKMQAIGTLTAGLAHEYYNIMTAIMGCTEFLEDNMPKDSPDHKYIDVIQKSVERAVRTTQALLQYSRKQAVNFSYLNLNDVVRHIEMLVEHLKVKDIRVKFEPAEDPITIRGDRSQIEQVLMNLATNAIDAMPEGGSLRISTELVEFRADTIEKQAYIIPGKYVLLSVVDTGTGIPGELQERIFEPFFTTKDVGQGTGLGLSMAYGIVKGHQGYINVQSEPGRGTTFKIYLPAVEAAGQGA